MKKVCFQALALMILCCIAVSCIRRNTVVSDVEALQSELDSLITEWHRAAAGSDHAGYIGAMSETGFYLGTDATERWSTREFEAWSKPYFDRKKGWNLVSLERHFHLSSEGNTAWFDELLDTGMGLCRGSGVLEKINGEWKISHYVLSPTVPNELISEVKKLKSRHDSLLIGKLKSSP